MSQILEGYVCLYWGDSGKGKLVDEAAERARQQDDGKRIVVVRSHGGPNAGHTICFRENGDLKQMIVHAAPSGLASGVDIAIGPHVAFDPEKFWNEFKNAQEFGYNGRVMISERVGILLDYHRKLDLMQEHQREASTPAVHVIPIGTTGSGIGPFYQDNARRDTRITFADYVSEQFPEILQQVLEKKRFELKIYGIIDGKYSQKKILNELVSLHEPIRRELKHFAERLEYRLQEYLDKGHHIIVEGAQGTGLDVDLGTLPMVTSSHVLMPQGLASLGLPRRAFKIIGVEKIYPTRVGNGVMPTLDEELENVGEMAGEYGATTGRKRRVGWPDWVFAHRSAFLNDCDSIALTRVDCLQDREVKVCTQYLLDDELTEEVPLNLSKAKAVYGRERFNWHLWDGPRDVSKPLKVDAELRDKRWAYVKEGLESLPRGLRAFVTAHNTYVGVPIEMVSIGAAQGETVKRESIDKLL